MSILLAIGIIILLALWFTKQEWFFTVFIIFCLLVSWRYAHRAFKFQEIPTLYWNSVSIQGSSKCSIGKTDYTRWSVGPASGKPAKCLFNLEYTSSNPPQLVAESQSSETIVWLNKSQLLNGIQLEEGDVIEFNSWKFTLHKGYLYYKNIKTFRPEVQRLSMETLILTHLDTTASTDLTIFRKGKNLFLMGNDLLTGKAALKRNNRSVIIEKTQIKSGDVIAWGAYPKEISLSFSLSNDNYTIDIQSDFRIPLDIGNNSEKNLFVLSNKIVSADANFIILDGISPNNNFNSKIMLTPDKKEYDFTYFNKDEIQKLHYNHKFIIHRQQLTGKDKFITFMGEIDILPQKQESWFLVILFLTLLAPLIIMFQSPSYSTTLGDKSKFFTLFGLFWLILIVRFILSLRVTVLLPYNNEALTWSLLLLIGSPLAFIISINDSQKIIPYYINILSNNIGLFFHIFTVVCLAIAILPIKYNIYLILMIAIGILFSYTRKDKYFRDFENYINKFSLVKKWLFCIFFFLLLVILIPKLFGKSSQLIWGMRYDQFTQLIFLIVFYFLADHKWSKIVKPQPSSFKRIKFYIFMFMIVILWLGLNTILSHDFGLIILMLPTFLIILITDLKSMVDTQLSIFKVIRVIKLYILPITALAVLIFFVLILFSFLGWYASSHPKSIICDIFDTKDIARVSGDKYNLFPTILASYDYASRIQLKFNFLASVNGGVGFAKNNLLPDVYSSAQNDKLFANLLMAEHGYWSGILLLALFITITLLILYLLLTCRGITKKNNPPEFHKYSIPRLMLTLVPLLSLSLTALWIMCSNMLIVPYIGKNIPWLGLNSGMDALYGLILVTWLLSSLRRTDRPLSDNDNKIKPYSAPTLSIGLNFLFICAALGSVIASLIIINKNTSYSSFEIDERYPNVVDSLFIGSEGKPPILHAEYRNGAPFIDFRSPEDKGLKKLLQKTALFRDIIKFNRNPQEYPIFIVDNALSYPVKSVFNREYAKIVNPFAQKYFFQGNIFLSEQSPAFVLKEIDIIWSSKPCPDSTNKVNLLQLHRSGLEVYNIGLDAVLNCHGGPPVLINDVKVQNGAVRLKEGDKITYYDQNDGFHIASYKLETEIDALVKNIWINGLYRHYYPQKDNFYMAKSIVEAFELYGVNLRIKHWKNPSITHNLDALKVELSIDKNLQEVCQDSLAEFCQSNFNNLDYSERDNLPASALIMDCLTGNILALASYPEVDPNDYSYFENHRISPERLTKIQTNQNLVPHVMASAGKPILSTVSLTLHPDMINFTFIRPSNSANYTVTNFLGLELPENAPIKAHSIPVVDFESFLTYSDNFYNDLFQTFSLLDTIPPQYFNDLPCSLSYKFHPYDADFRSDTPRLQKIIDKDDNMNHLEDKAWPKTMYYIFSIPYEKTDLPSPVTNNLIWNSLKDDFQVDSIYSLPIAPHLHNHQFADYKNYRYHWLSFVTGGMFRLNNCQIASCFSRILTKKFVQPKLVTMNNSLPSDTLSFDFIYDMTDTLQNNFSLACSKVIEACKYVIQRPAGTAYPSQLNILTKYGFDPSDLFSNNRFAFGKTGTIKRNPTENPLLGTIDFYKPERFFYRLKNDSADSLAVFLKKSLSGGTRTKLNNEPYSEELFKRIIKEINLIISNKSFYKGSWFKDKKLSSSLKNLYRRPTHGGANVDILNRHLLHELYPQEIADYFDVRNSTLWIGVYGTGTIDNPTSAYCLVVYAQDRGEGYALRIANKILPHLLNNIYRN